MHLLTDGNTDSPIYRGMLSLVCLAFAVSVAQGDDSPVARDTLARRLRPEPTIRVQWQPVRGGQSGAEKQAPSAAETRRQLELSRVNVEPTEHGRQARHAPAVSGNQHESKPPRQQQAVVQTSFEYGGAHCDDCGSHSCDGGCGEPVCGLEAAYGCDSYVDPYGPTCGLEATCGIDEAYGCDSRCGPNRARYPGQGRFRGSDNFTVRGEYLLWWVNGFSIPPLLTTSSAGTDIADAGILGLPSTSVVYGNQTLLEDARSGGRFTFDYWFDCEQTAGIEAIYTGLGEESSSFAADSQQFPILARPFFNVEPGAAQQDAELISFPGALEGNALVESESTLQGVEVLYRHSLCRDCCFRLDGLIGWRHNRLDEALHFSDFKRILSDEIGPPIGTTLEEADWFETHNSFNGVELGIIAQARRCHWWLESVMKMALGNNHSEVGIDGHAVFTVPGGQPPVTTTPAGLLAQNSNIGVHESDDFAVVPELGVTLGCDLTCHWRATIGYTFIYWSRVARPGDQIDTDLNLTQLETTGLVGIPRPAPTGVLTDLWAQGLRFGLESHF